MKRFMLVSLMSCLLVGQISCVWSWKEYAKGVGSAVVGIGLSAGIASLLSARSNGYDHRWHNELARLAEREGHGVSTAFYSKLCRTYWNARCAINPTDTGFIASGAFTLPLLGRYAVKLLPGTLDQAGDDDEDTWYNNKSFFAGLATPLALPAALLVGLGLTSGAFVVYRSHFQHIAQSMQK